MKSRRRHLCITLHVQMAVRVGQGLENQMQLQAGVRHQGRHGHGSMSYRLVKMAFVYVFWCYVRRGVFENHALGRDLILGNVYVSVGSYDLLRHKSKNTFPTSFLVSITRILREKLFEFIRNTITKNGSGEA